MTISWEPFDLERFALHIHKCTHPIKALMPLKAYNTFVRAKIFIDFSYFSVVETIPSKQFQENCWRNIHEFTSPSNYTKTKDNQRIHAKNMGQTRRT